MVENTSLIKNSKLYLDTDMIDKHIDVHFRAILVKMGEMEVTGVWQKSQFFSAVDANHCSERILQKFYGAPFPDPRHAPVAHITVCLRHFTVQTK